MDTTKNITQSRTVRALVLGILFVAAKMWFEINESEVTEIVLVLIQVWDLLFILCTLLAALRGRYVAKDKLTII